MSLIYGIVECQHFLCFLFGNFHLRFHIFAKFLVINTNFFGVCDYSEFYKHPYMRFLSTINPLHEHTCTVSYHMVGVCVHTASTCMYHLLCVLIREAVAQREST